MNKRKSIILITVLIFIAIITSLAIGIAVQKSKPKIIVADITERDEI